MIFHSILCEYGSGWHESRCPRYFTSHARLPNRFTWYFIFAGRNNFHWSVEVTCHTDTFKPSSWCCLKMETYLKPVTVVFPSLCGDSNWDWIPFMLIEGLSTTCSSSVVQNDVNYHLTLQWCHNERDGVPNHQPPECLLNRLFRGNHRKHKSSASLVVVRGIHRWPVNYPHKWPVTRKCFHFMTSSWMNFPFCKSVEYIKNQTSLEWHK